MSQGKIFSELSEFAHINLKWKKNPYKKEEWQLVFDHELLGSLTRGQKWWHYFFPEITAKAHNCEWRVKVEGRGPHLYTFHRRDILGMKAFEMGFKNKYKEGMFNADHQHSFRWKPQAGNSKQMAWHLDGLEVIRFEKTGHTFSSPDYSCTIARDDLKQSWMAVMLISGLMALRNGKI